MTAERIAAERRPEWRRRVSAQINRVGTPMGQQTNIWIAPTAGASDAILLTTDKDFDVLHPHIVQREWVDQTSLKS